MDELTRYEPYQPWWDGSMSMDAVPHGQWVRYDDALTACEIARRDERERIATHFEENDYGIIDGDAVANIIRKEFEDEK